MACAAALQSDTIWLQLNNYDVVPLNGKLAPRVANLSTALGRGVAACPDDSREGFYDVEFNDEWAYIHVHDGSRTVYLVA